MTRTLLSALLCGLLSPAAAALAKDPPLDTSYLKDHAETRGFMLGRPSRPKPTPDGKAVLFLRAQPRVARLRLYEFDVTTGVSADSDGSATFVVTSPQNTGRGLTYSSREGTSKPVLRVTGIAH